MSVLRRCSHSNAVPVEIDGTPVAALCPDCDTQLTVSWLRCDHEDYVDIPELGDRPPYKRVCKGCGVVYWPEGDADAYAR